MDKLTRHEFLELVKVVKMLYGRDVAEEVIDYMNAAGEKVGLVKVRLYRPFWPWAMTKPS